MKSIFLTIALGLLAGTALAADPAPPASPQPAPVNQKKIQSACMKENAKDHAAYLKCVTDHGGKVTKTVK